MNVFVLSTGRCGSLTFSKACKHITNYTSSHESNVSIIGEKRLIYPDNHIEIDNRLSWFLGRIDKKYNDNAVYIHLHRDKVEIAKSYMKRYQIGIMKAYKQGIHIRTQDNIDKMVIALDLYDTVTSNIELFLKDKTKKLNFNLENAKEDFKKFWEFIGAEGNLDAALAEWGNIYNASKEDIYFKSTNKYINFKKFNPKKIFKKFF